MSKIQVSAKTGKDGDKMSVTYDPGDSLADMVKRSSVDDADGEAIVFSEARAARVIKIQDILRLGLKAGKSQKEIQAEVDGYKPGLKKRGRSKSEKLKDDFAKLSPEEKKALLSKLTG